MNDITTDSPIMASASPSTIAHATAVIVAAAINHSNLAVEQIGSMTTDIFNRLSGEDGSQAPAAVEAAQPAVPIKKSVHGDYIVCLEDGKKMKLLKRYIKTNFNMTPDQYRQKWNLPSDYPMVAPNYAERRRDLAKTIGLGRKPGSTGAKRGRPSKADVAAREAANT